MKIPLVSALVLALAFAAVSPAQNSSSAPQNSQTPAGAGQNGNGAGQGNGQVSGGGYGRRGSEFGGRMGAGNRLMGTVTEVAAGHYTIKIDAGKTDAGETYTVHFSADTRIFKMPAYPRGEGQAGGQGGGQGQGRGSGGNPPQQLKPSDIKVGDVIQVRGDVDATAKSVSAMTVVKLDPEQVKQMREMEANYGKTWLQGEVTAIDGVKVTLMGSVDNAPHSFVADEDTTFRRRRVPITLADIQVGDVVLADGAVKDGVFTAAGVVVMGGTAGENPTVPRSAPGAAPGAAPASPPPAPVKALAAVRRARQFAGSLSPGF
jgi:hypothetical protein